MVKSQRQKKTIRLTNERMWEKGKKVRVDKSL